MPNIKSAEKRVRIIEKKTAQNNMIKTGVKTAIRKFETAVAEGNKNDAEVLLVAATKKIEKSCSKGVIKKNTASRKKSRLAKMLNTMN